MTTDEATRRMKKRKKQFKKLEICSEEKEAFDKYVSHIERTVSQNPYTLEKYYRYITQIEEELEQARIHKLPEHRHEELAEINKEIMAAIQSSRFKKGGGDYIQKTKEDMWLAWKKALECQGIDTRQHKNYMPEASFSSNQSETDTQADTTPQDLPTVEDMKQLCQSLEKCSSQKTSLRNVAFPLFIWDAGTRIGETLPIQMKHVSVREDRVKVKIQGNKDSDDRKIEIFQGRKTLKDYIQQHPKKDDPEAFLFCDLHHNNYHSKLGRNGLKKKLLQAKEAADLEFKTFGEPFHIFRKAMSTFYTVNIMSWEEVCERQGKSPDGTMPTYLKMAMSDIDASAAEGFGLESKEREKEGRMRAPPLLPKDCGDCGRRNRCYRDICQSCGKELEDSNMPDNLETDEEKIEMRELASQIKAVIESAENIGVDTEELI